MRSSDYHNNRPDMRQSRGNAPQRGQNNRSTGSTRILYDARGRRIPERRFSDKLTRALLFFVLPYVVVNGIIFFLVTATPKLDLKVADTANYQTTDVTFHVNSLLPLKNLSVTLNSQPVEYTKNGSDYTAVVSSNGTFYVETTALNGMKTSSFVNVNVIDDTPPSIDEDTCKIENGDLIFQISDVESGVDFDSIYGVYDGSKQVYPTKIDRETGTVTIPMYTDSIVLHFSDKVGNAQAGTITASSGGDTETDLNNDSEAADSETEEVTIS